MAEEPQPDIGPFERAAAEMGETHFVLHLYVAGTNPRSLLAVERVTRLCEAHLAGRYELEVVDIYQHPALAEEDQVIAAPTLVRSLPAPLRRLVGDMSDEGQVLLAIGIRDEDA